MQPPITPGNPEPYTLASVMPAAPPPKRRRWETPVIVGGIVLALAGGSFVVWELAHPPAVPAAASSPTTEPAPRTTTVEARTYTPPKPADFTLAVKVLGQHCFGSAGCSVTYTVDLTYAGGEIEPGKTWDVTYTVTGGDDPQIDTIQLTRGASASQYRYVPSREQLIDTPSSASVLTVAVTSVSPH